MIYDKIIIVAEYFYPNTIVGALRMTCLAQFLYSKKIPVEIITSQNNRIICNDLNIPATQVVSKKHFLLKTFFYYCTIKKKTKKKKNAIFLYCGGPFFYFFVAYLIKKFYRVEYILDFRDSWCISDTDSISKSFKVKIYLSISSFIERLAIKNAKYVINVTNELNEKYKEKYHKIDQSKFKVIFNGYARNEIDNRIIHENILFDSNTLKLAVAGKLSYYNPIDSEIISEYIHSSEYNCKLYHIGYPEDKLIADFQKFNCTDKLECTGQKNYIECMSYLNTMDVLILNNRSKYALGTKVFDYMYLNKPILGFVEKKSALDNLLKHYEGYFRISNIDDMKKAIHSIIHNKINILSENIDIDSFSRDIQFEKLLKLLE
jgi:hypothetical protein